METDHRDNKWIIVRIDGKIAAVSTDYRMLASISASLAKNMEPERTSRKEKSGRKKPCKGSIYGEITATAVDMEEVWRLKQVTAWDDLMLFGTEFQKRVWRKLWELTHEGEIPEQVGNDRQEETPEQPGLVSYSDFAGLCQNRAGVRAVAHAIGLNPVSVIIPCHLVVPKESIDKINDIKAKAEATIFKGDDLCINSILSDSSIDFGEYALGRKTKRDLILKELI